MKYTVYPGQKKIILAGKQDKITKKPKYNLDIQCFSHYRKRISKDEIITEKPEYNEVRFIIENPDDNEEIYVTVLQE